MGRTTLALTVVLLLTSTIQAATDVGGIITTDTTWDLTGSPFVVASNVIVDQGATLTIEPGVEVKFNPSRVVDIVNGSLVARGEVGNPIRFHTLPPQVGGWGRIGFGPGAQLADFDASGQYLTGSIIEHAEFEMRGGGPYPAIEIVGSSPYIRNNTFLQVDGHPTIRARNAPDLRVVDNVFTSGVLGASETALEVSDSDKVLFADNKITNSGGTLIDLRGNREVVVYHNTVEQNPCNEILRAVDNTKLIISDNHFVNDSQDGLVLAVNDDVIIDGNFIDTRETGVRLDGGYKSGSVRFFQNHIVSDALGM